MTSATRPSERDRLRRALAILLAALWSPACSDSDAAGAAEGGTRDDAGHEGSAGAAGAAGQPACETNRLAEDDPLAGGQHTFLYDSFGTEQLDGWPPADFMLSLMTSEPDVFGNQYEEFGFIADPDDELPIGFKRGLLDPTRVRETCALCHVARLDGGCLWYGAPNVALDIGRFKVEVDERWVAAGNPPMLSDLSRQKALQLGPGRVNAESGGYPHVVPADFPPYFLLGQRTHMNYLGTGANVRTEIYLSIFTFGAGSPNAETAPVPFPPADHVDELAAFLGSLGPPPAPPATSDQVAAGKSAFEKARCGSCHHSDVRDDGIVTIASSGAAEKLPGEDPAFPRGTIATDKLHRVLQDGDPDAGSDPDAGGVDVGYQDLIAFIIEHQLQVALSDGYRTSALVGLGVTAPYLHNGSVPTLGDLLNKAEDRPATFERNGFQVDTSLPGNGNGGHEFGTELSGAEKAALVAYLKTL